MRRDLSFAAATACELALLGLVAFFGLLGQRSPFEGFHWSSQHVIVGIAATGPPLAFFLWSINTKLPLFTRHQELSNALIRRIFSDWSVLQLLAISIIAGIAEESFFRGAIQGGLAERIGPVLALVLASVAFGAAHMITWTYAVIAGGIGAYLGLVWMWTGNLLAPIVTHAVYDFLALLYFLRRYQKR